MKQSTSKVSKCVVVQGITLRDCVYIAVKQLNSETAPAAFLQEYKSLLKAPGPGHPNIVQIMLAEVLEGTDNVHDSIQRFGFIFPLAMGNLKELLRDLLKQLSLLKLRSTTFMES